jgi:hypothetical protein
MDFLRFSQRQGNGWTAEDNDILYNAESIGKWRAWRETLNIDNNWQSARIMALIMNWILPVPQKSKFSMYWYFYCLVHSLPERCRKIPGLFWFRTDA